MPEASSPKRRTTRRCSRCSTGARRAGHRHRWRDPPRELLEPLRHRARRHRPRRARRHRATARRTRPCRASSARSAALAPSRSATCSSCGGTPTAPVKITFPGPFTMGQQAQDDYYGDARDAGAGLRRRRQRGDPRPVRRRRRHRPDRRAVVSQAPPSRPALTASRRRPRAARASRARRRAPLLRLRGGRRKKPTGYAFLASSDSTADQISIEAAQPRLDLASLATLAAARRSCSACSTWRSRGSSRWRRSGPPPRGTDHVRPSSSSPPPTAA